MATISVTVADTDQNPIEGATVTVSDSATGTTEKEGTTDVNGEYGTSIDPDTYDILIERIGYNPDIEEEVTIKTDDDYTLAVELDTIKTKVIGSVGDAEAVGVLGEITANTGTSIGVKGAVVGENGYGLFTPDDARVDGVTELDALAGSLTGGAEITTLLGENLSVDSGALTANGPIVQTTTPAVAEAGTDWKRLDDRGTEIWKSSYNSYVKAIFERDGVVYTGDRDGVVTALDATDGSFIWQHTHHTESVEGVFERDGVVYSAAQDNTVVAADANNDGSSIWDHTHHSDSPSIPRVWTVFERNGIVYSGGADKAVVAADATDGSLLWDHTHHTNAVRSVFERNGVVYSASRDETVVAADVNDNGSLLWDHSLHTGVVYSVFERNGVVYSGSLDDTIVAADAADGSKIWQQDYGGPTIQTVFERNGVVYAGGLDTNASDYPVIAADANDGTELWRHDLHSQGVSQIFERNGVVYSAASDNTAIAAVSDPATHVSDGTEWLFESRLVDDRDGGQLG